MIPYTIVSVRIPQKLKEAAIKAAEQEGVSLTVWLIEAIQQRIGVGQ